MLKVILTSILFFCASFSIHAQTELSKLISIEIEGKALQTVLDEITKQSGVNFSFNAQTIDATQTVSLKVEEASLSQTLDFLCDQIRAEYQLVEGLIILQKKAAAEFYTLSGFITDQVTGENLIGASLLLVGSARGVVTNAFGYYSIQLEPGAHQLDYSYLGYTAEKLEVSVQKNLRRDISLKTAQIELPDIIVERSANELLQERMPGSGALSPEELRNMPEFAGESGLVKGLQSLPGVQMHSDGSAFFYVRGGERDQNLVIIDDAPIYNPSHLFGFYSTIIPDFTKSIQVFKSDMPVRIGDRLSSIVSIRTKDGNSNRFVLSGAINPLVYRVSIETPIIKKRGSLFASFRRSNFEWLYKREAPDANLGFADLNLKWNHKINDKNRIYLTAIFSNDDFNNNNEERLAWANTALVFRWNHIFGPKLFSNTTLYSGSYNYQLRLPPNNWKSGLGTLSLKSDFTHYVNPKYKAEFGLELQAYFIDPGTFTLDSTIAILPEISRNYSNKTTLYYQGSYSFSDQLRFKGGLRFISWANNGPLTHYTFDEQFQVSDTIISGDSTYNRYFTLDPRLSVEYQLDPTALIKVHFGIYHQFLQLISNSQSPYTSFALWLPANPNIKPQRAWQITGSYLKQIPKLGLEWSAAVFFKKYFNQIDYEPHSTLLLNPLVEGELRFGTGRSYGLEFFLKKELGRLNGWIGYTWSRAFRQFPDLNEGIEFRAFQDRPHDFSIMLNYQLARRTFFSAYYTIVSGATFTSPTGFYNFNGQTIPIYNDKNNDRLPTYKRLDLGIKFLLNKNPDARYQHSLTFSIYNFLARKNTVAVNFNRIPIEDDERPAVRANRLTETALTASQTDLIRFFPSLTYKFQL